MSEKELIDSIKEDPTNTTAHRKLAVLLYVRKHDNTGAEEHFTKAIELAPEDVSIKLEWAHFLQAYDFKRAEQLIQEAYELEPGNAEVYCGQACLWYHREREITYRSPWFEPDASEVKETRGLYEKAMELDPANARYPHLYSLFEYWISKDYRSAIELCVKSIELDPSGWHHYSNYAAILRMIRDDLVNDDQGYEKLPFDITDEKIQELQEKADELEIKKFGHSCRL
ncbi:MAG: hypothetical protein ACFFCS_26530 [Candidatus Hodarchaeota archaeon]